MQAASIQGHNKIVQILLERGADVNAQGGEYGNALQAALVKGHDQAVVKMLLEHGADVNAQGGFHGNALQAASARGRDRIVQTLLEHGADVNAQGGFHGNALQAALAKGHDQVVQILLKHGARATPGDKAFDGFDFEKCLARYHERQRNKRKRDGGSEERDEAKRTKNIDLSSSPSSESRSYSSTRYTLSPSP